MENNVFHWMYPPQLLTPNKWTNNVLTILIDMRMSLMDLLLAIHGPQVKYKPYKDSLYHGNPNAINYFLNVVEAEKQGCDKLKSWLDVQALDILLKRVNKEMDSLCVFHIKDLTRISHGIQSPVSNHRSPGATFTVALVDFACGCSNTSCLHQKYNQKG
jgi:hypothetical protein